MNVVAWFIRQVNALFMLFRRRQRIALLSRQSHNPLDFELLKPHLKRAFPQYDIVQCCVREGGKLGVFVAARQLWLSATSTLSVVDGYVPAVCIPRNTDEARRNLPPCVQMWHALGAVKKFGYQSLDTKAGRSSAVARSLSMHRGYTAVIAGLSGAVPAFSQAFGYEERDIVPLGLPRIDYLTRDEYRARRNRRSQAIRRGIGLADAELDRRLVILYAPTFRKNAVDHDWHRRYITDLYHAIPENTVLVVSGHPLDHFGPDDPRRINDVPRLRFLKSAASIDALPIADYVVTDYSAIAFEAMLIGKKVLFYVPDLDEYRESPGLNIDPERDLGSITFREAETLGRFIADDMTQQCYDQGTVEEFAQAYGIAAMRESQGCSCARITRFLATVIQQSQRKDPVRKGTPCTQ